MSTLRSKFEDWVLRMSTLRGKVAHRRSISMCFMRFGDMTVSKSMCFMGCGDLVFSKSTCFTRFCDLVVLLSMCFTRF